MVERSAEQQSALSRSAGLLDSVRKRLGTPAGGAEPMATPRAGLIAAVGSALPPPTAHVSSIGAAGETLRPLSGAALKENLAAELNRSSLRGMASAPPSAAPPPSSFAAAAAAALHSSGGGGDSALQQASNLFLQQMEDMRRKHTAEVERLKVGGCGAGQCGMDGNMQMPSGPGHSAAGRQH